MGELDDSEAQRALAMRFGFPVSVLTGVGFTAMFAMFTTFSGSAIITAYLEQSQYTRQAVPLDEATTRFMYAWRASKYDSIVFLESGTLFARYLGMDNRARQLAAVPGLRSHGFSDEDLVAAVRDSRELTYVLEALNNGVAREYATA